MSPQSLKSTINTTMENKTLRDTSATATAKFVRLQAYYRNFHQDQVVMQYNTARLRQSWIEQKTSHLRLDGINNFW